MMYAKIVGIDDILLYLVQKFLHSPLLSLLTTSASGVCSPHPYRNCTVRILLGVLLHAPLQLGRLLLQLVAHLLRVALQIVLRVVRNCEYLFEVGKATFLVKLRSTMWLCLFAVGT